MKKKTTSGFSLIELIVAMGMFLVVGGVAVTLVQQHTKLFNTAQNQSGLNIAMRNSVAQLQMDIVNAGGNYYPGSNMPFWPVGVTMTQATPATVTACKASRVYVTGCFDQLTLMTGDDQMPAGNLTATTSTAGASNLTFSLTFPDAPIASVVAARAARFSAGNEILLIQANSTGTPLMAPLVLAGPGVAVGTSVQLTTLPFNATVSDTLKIFDSGDSASGDFTTNFSTGDYVISLVPIVYSVNVVGNDPQLVRTVSGVTDVVADQVIGFTVSPFTDAPVAASGNLTPRYTNTPSDYGSNWTSIRAVQVQLVARATPNTDITTGTFANAYDQGPYQVQAISVVVNPRNLTMDN